MSLNKSAAADAHESITTTDKEAINDFDWRVLFAYRTPKMVRVNVWQLGLAFTLAQLGLMGYVCWAIYAAAQWSSEADVSNTINAYLADGGSGLVSAADAPYCNGNSSYDYDFGGGWTYLSPECRAHSSASISVKGPGQVFLTTMYTETAHVGWACDAADAAAQQAACSSGGGVFSQASLQCSCKTDSTIYPVGVEDMTLSFRHTFKIDEQSAPNLKGDSLLTEETAEGVKPLDTYFGDVRYASGGAITLTITELLALVGVSLDSYNTAEPRDARPSVDRFPMYRTTGVMLNVDIEYSNKDPETGKPDISKSAVRAEASISAADGWAGLGALPTIYVTFPNNYTYSEIVRYRQGVLVSFRGKGLYYYFDFVTLVMALVTSAVLLSSATVVTDFIATNLYRIKRKEGGGLAMELTATSRVLRNKRVEPISPEFVMATQSMRAVFAVASFRALDEDNDGVVDGEDIVRAFAKVGGVTHTEACEMAKLVMNKGDRSNGQRDGVLTFTEFVSVLAQDTMPFSELLACMNARNRYGLSDHLPLQVNSLDEAKFLEEKKKAGFGGKSGREHATVTV